jgi:hypothetical protein
VEGDDAREGEVDAGAELFAVVVLAHLVCDGPDERVVVRVEISPRPGRGVEEIGAVRSDANDLGVGALLIRPDGIVAWADDHDPDHEAFRRAATRWFGDRHPDGTS